MRYIIPCILLVLTTCLCADEPKHADEGKVTLAELRNSIEVLRNQGQAAVARTEKTFDKEVENLKKKALKSLKIAMDDAIEAKDLDGAVALRELIKNTENLDAGNVTKAAIANQPEEAKSEAANNKLEGKGIVPISGEVIVATPLGTRWHYRFDRNGDVRILSWTLPNERSKPFSAAPADSKLETNATWHRETKAWVCYIFHGGTKESTIQRIVFDDRGTIQGLTWNKRGGSNLVGTKIK
jgi:hypothetical protein